MKNFSHILLYVFLFSTSVLSFSQPVSKKEFHQLFIQGNLMELEGYFDTAAKVFLHLNTSDPSNANLNYKIGYCFLNLPNQRLKAIPYLENAIKQISGTYLQDEPTEKNAPENARYYLGKAYHYAYRFDDAIIQFEKYKEIIKKRNLPLLKDIEYRIQMSKNAKDLVSKPQECTITNLGDSVNCEFADYSPLISADESILTFTSRRLGTGGAANKTIKDEFLEDIWICNKGLYGTWTKAKNISRLINTDQNEATIGLSADGQQLYLYKDDKGDGNIYLSTKDGDFWNAPIKITGNINSKNWEPSACVSADENYIYFVSDRKGGFGGRDIYQCHKLPNNTWSDPENLGPTINTQYDEDAPFMHPDGTTFFFSSTGHNSMGGFDVFYTTKVANNVWTNPINIGYPINTIDDDIYFVTSSDGRRAFFSSLRPEGKGEKDIYMVSMPKPFVRSVAILVGYLKTKDGTAIPKNSLVTTKSSNGQIFSTIPNEASGKFIQSLFPGMNYDVTIEANGKKIFTDVFYLPQDSSYQNLGRGFFQQTIMIGDTTNPFSLKKVLDTTTKIEVTPMDGEILFDQNKKDVAKNLMLDLLNLQGNIIASTITNSNGYFIFQNISSDQKYLIKINENDPSLKEHQQFYLANKAEDILFPSSQESNFVLFKNVSPKPNKLNIISATDPALSTTVLSGKLSLDKNGNKPISNVAVILSDQQGKIIQKKSTNNSGYFIFEHTSSDINYAISIKDDDSTLVNQQSLFLANNNTGSIRKTERMGGYFVFKNTPPDSNLLIPSDQKDDAKLVTIKGAILKSSNKEDGIANLSITLIDSKGKIIQRAKTDALGAFKLQKPPTDNNFTIKINENDPQLYTLKNAYLSNEDGRILKEIDLRKNEKYFSNLQLNLRGVINTQDVSISSSIKNNVPIIKGENIVYPGDEKFDFAIYFPYNKKEINITVSTYISLANKILKKTSNNDTATIVITASSSTVPTSFFLNNELLAKSRATEIINKIKTSMKLNKINESKINFNSSYKVQGPEYKNDAIQNRKKYEQWQFVKVIVN
jgi:hypothetical protein